MIGTRLAHYDVERHLGSGGMGDVYQAKDTRLGRKVALKLLPAAFASDPERLARFEREARVLASLNHPNIAALHGLEQADDRRLLVMELVEGETLADRIAHGPLPVADALQLARQMAEALEAAHAKGVVHRDLKPANVKVTPDGKVKVLDFGLARAFDPASSDPAGAATLTSPALMTHQGAILGTAAYMSPEQAKGREVDARADIFAFGCVLFEMLTGRRSFPGDTITESIASVLAREADLTLLPANIHPRIHELLRRCLEKDPARRWQAIGDARVEIETILQDPHGLKIASARTPPAPLWKRALPLAAAIVFTAGATFGITRALRPAPPPPPAPVRFSFTLPTDQGFTRTGRHILAVSPDGASVVYVANNQIYLRRLSEKEAKPISGTNQDVNTPFFSPDGRWVAFCAIPENKLKKIPIGGGASVTLADIDNPYGAQWYAEDAMLIGQGPRGIVRVPAGGGKPETVIEMKPGEIAQSPQMLPDGQTVLFTLTAGGSQDWDRAQIVAQSLTSGQRTTLVEGGSDGRYVSSGHLVYAQGTTVYAAPFDAALLKVTGSAEPVVEGVARASCCTGAAFFSVAGNGTFVAVPGTSGVGDRVLALVSRSGDRKTLDLPPAAYSRPRFSPDGRQIAFHLVGSLRETNIWVYDLTARAAPRRLTFGGDSFNPVWTPDGKRLVFIRADALWWQAADGSGSAEQLVPAEAGRGISPQSFPRQANTLSFIRSLGLWTMGLDGDRSPKPLLRASGSTVNESRFSPDGRWIAYTSNETSRNEVYVEPVPPTGAKYLVSRTGGLTPVWSPDGRQLFYMTSSTGFATAMDTLVSVDVRTEPSFAFSSPVPLPIRGFVVATPYDISPDGRQFIMVFPPSETTSGTNAPLQIDVVLNWFAELASAGRR